MNLHMLNNSSRPVAVPWVGQSFAFAYNPKGYTETIYTETVKVGKMADEDPMRLQINAMMLLSMLTAWDLTEDCPEDDLVHRTNGNTQFCHEHAIPINAETIAALPTVLRGRMVSKIMEDMGSDGNAPKSDVS